MRVESGVSGGQPAEAPRPQSLADVTDHIVARFDGRIAPQAVARMVRHCNRELTLTRGRAEPAVVEHLAAYRLAQTL